MFNFKRSISKNILNRLVIKKQKREWEERLKHFITVSEKTAKEGKYGLTISENHLKCDYNNKRTIEEILKDIRDKFKNCSVNYGETAYGSKIVQISWE